MKAEVTVKQDSIVETAIKRFAHFGVGKTTMAEIADDLQISKPSLFYYFNDKSSLMKAVGKKIIDEVLESFEAVFNSANSVEEGLLNFVEVKRQFFKKYMLLAIQPESLEANKMMPEMADYVMVAHNKTEVLIANFLQSGIDKKTLRPVDTNKTSHIIVETLHAFEQCIKSKSPMVKTSEIDNLFDKQKAVIQLLLNGIKNSEWKS